MRALRVDKLTYAALEATLAEYAAGRAETTVPVQRMLTLTADEGKAIVKAHKKSGKTFLTGSQQRSDDRFRMACEMVRNGRIGKVKKVTCAIGGGACLFSGLFIFQATLCFWTTESIEIVNCTTYGGVEAAQFPLTIYRPWFRAIFTFVIPLATINYFPAQVLLNLDDALGSTRLIQWLSPLAGVLFLWICLRFWNFGVKHYRSTGN